MKTRDSAKTFGEKKTDKLGVMIRAVKSKIIQVMIAGTQANKKTHNFYYFIKKKHNKFQFLQLLQDR